MLIALAAAALAAPAHADNHSSTCPDPANAKADVEKTISDFFDAVRLKDKAPMEALTTKRFYAFDVGARFSGTALNETVVEALDEGIEINWVLQPMDTQVRCDVAWSQWENIGSAGTPPDLEPVRWLESAVLVHEDGRWKLDFFHSQRARGE